MTRIEHLIIIDASGSMHCIRRNALNGCNETIQTIRSLQQKNTDQEHFLTLVSFNSDERCHYIYDHRPIAECADIQEAAYVPNACTPLYDAIGLSVCHLQDILRSVADSSKEAIVTIITDGQENSSTIFNADKVHSLIEECKQAGWTFAFIGANIDEVQEAGRIGIRNTMSFKQDAEGTGKMFATYASSVAEFCCAPAEERCEKRRSKFFRDDDNL